MGVGESVLLYGLVAIRTRHQPPEQARLAASVVERVDGIDHLLEFFVGAPAGREVVGMNGSRTPSCGTSTH